MYICVCKAITDKDFEEALTQGGSYKDICTRLGVGSDCGICLQEAYAKATSKNSLTTDATKNNNSQKQPNKF